MAPNHLIVVTRVFTKKGNSLIKFRTNKTGGPGKPSTNKESVLN